MTAYGRKATAGRPSAGKLLQVWKKIGMSVPFSVVILAIEDGMTAAGKKAVAGGPLAKKAIAGSKGEKTQRPVLVGRNLFRRV